MVCIMVSGKLLLNSNFLDTKFREVSICILLQLYRDLRLLVLFLL